MGYSNVAALTAQFKKEGLLQAGDVNSKTFDKVEK